MNILILTNIELDERNASGNTFANWLTGWSDTYISNIYSRNRPPKNKFCDEYYSVSPFDIIRYILTPWKIGRRFKSGEKIDGDEGFKEQGLIDNVKEKKVEIIYLLNDLLNSSRMWQNNKYKNFIKEINPDIIFYFAKADAFIYENIKYIKRHTKAKAIAFIADDMYTTYAMGKSLRRKIEKRRFVKMLKLADKSYGASNMLCDIYSHQFGLCIEPLYKGCTFAPVRDLVNQPLKIVYAGNLYWGRDLSLGYVARALQKINTNECKAFLEIYTTSKITRERDQLLNISGSSRVMGPRPFDEIEKILQKADIVLHVESFDDENIKTVKLSFSTKIIDCLQSGAMMLVVGPKGIASVEQARAIDGTLVVDDVNDIEGQLNVLVNNPSLIIDRANRIRNFAESNYRIDSVRTNLYQTFKRLIEK
ncbi:hypothetical protein [uncultured Alistipes sp.]|uniref:hypothetical protein n=1 Tax=uncultured Alistipes sp. TaxID=538949 RepID=UPI0026324D7F|nr:hypothetical protein [uncultured Alistipes sp.]